MSVKEKLQQLQDQERLDRIEAENALAQQRIIQQQEREREFRQWDREKGPLIEARQRLVQAGVFGMIEEVSRIVKDPFLFLRILN